MAEEFSENNSFQKTPQARAEASVQSFAVSQEDASELIKAVEHPTVILQQNATLKSELPSKNMFKCWAEALTRMFETTGRTSCYEFWAFQSVSLVIFLLLALIGYFLSEPKMVLDIFAIYFLFPAASSGARRLHDISISGWWIVPAVVLALTTLICWNLGVHNIVLLLFFTLVYVSMLYDFWRQIGDDADNKYGPKVQEAKYSNIESRAFISFMSAFLIGLWIIYAAYLIKF